MPRKVQDVCVSSSNNSNKSAISVWTKWMMLAKWLDTRNVQNKNKTPSSHIRRIVRSTDVYTCVIREYEWIAAVCQLFKTLRLELFDSFPCDFIVLALSTNTILRIFHSKAIHQARKWTHTPISISNNTWTFHLNGSKQNSVIHYAWKQPPSHRRRHRHIHREKLNPFEMNEFTHETPI